MPTMTAAQQREEAKVEFDAFLADCPSRLVLDRISDKWVTLVMCSPGRRSASVLRAVPPARRGQPEDADPDPAHPRARRTGQPIGHGLGAGARRLRADHLGHSLLDPIKHLKAWAEDHVPEVREAQETYDRERGEALS